MYKERQSSHAGEWGNVTHCLSNQETLIEQLSTGWDRKIYLWDLATFEMIDVFKNNNGIKASEELAADSLILGIDYSVERNEFAYCSADKMAYLRSFSTNGSEMKLLAVMQGHEAEVTQVSGTIISKNITETNFSFL